MVLLSKTHAGVLSPCIYNEPVERELEKSIITVHTVGTFQVIESYRFKFIDHEDWHFRRQTTVAFTVVHNNCLV